LKRKRNKLRQHTKSKRFSLTAASWEWINIRLHLRQEFFLKRNVEAIHLVTYGLYEEDVEGKTD
jgi:hypothetical protein